MADVSDKAPVDKAWGRVLDQASDAALRNAKKFLDAGLSGLRVRFSVNETEALRFLPGPGGDDDPQPVFDSNEGKATKPVELSFEVEGILAPPSIETKKEQ